MKRVHDFIATVTVAAVLASTAACASWGDKRTKGAGVGAAGGGAVGVVIGHETGSTARGAIIGAVVGGVAGAVIGDRMDKPSGRPACADGDRGEVAPLRCSASFEGRKERQT